MAIATGQYTIIDLNDVDIATTPPLNPVEDQLWLDTSVVPNVLKRWGWIEDEEGWGWINASPTSPEDIGAETPDGAQAKVDAVEVGGRNLILNSADLTQIKVFGVAGIPTIEPLDRSPTGEVWHLSDIERDHIRNVWFLPLKTMAPGFYEIGKDYTLSFWIKANTSQSITLSINNASVREYSDTSVTTDYKRIAIRIAPTAEGAINYNAHVGLAGENLTDVYVFGLKLERGNKPTDWTPAPEDGDTTELYIGSLSDEGETPNAVLADFVLHDSSDIDPEGYLAGVPNGGGE